jgi:hypothetical protein
MSNKDPSIIRLNNLKKIISKRARIRYKACLVLSNDPPIPEFHSVKKVKVVKPYQKVSLPPLSTRRKLNNTLSLSRTPVPFKQYRVENCTIGVLEGIAKMLV